MTNESYVISRPEHMCIRRDDEMLYGCNQDWYRIEFRRRAGCGPVAATNIIMYLKKRYGAQRIPYQNDSVEDALTAMNDVFLYVRPKRRGLHTVKKFVKGMCRFGRKYGIRLWYQYTIVPPQADMRPGLEKIVDFIKNGLAEDVPIAFLNLDAGEVEDQLSSWHWVTVYELQCVADVGAGEGAGEGADEGAGDGVGESTDDGVGEGAGEDTGAGADGFSYILRYYDQSKSLEVNLGRWLSTTVKGGGFAYFCRPSDRRP
ncbi:MAG: hypothetical protein FWH01_08595 [Oscillospiraceae bacterium]|nr:hypothetical protein [Oscillospiraceae bacterium]